MPPVIAERQRHAPEHGAHVQRRVKMGKQRAAAGRFVFERRPERLAIDGGNDKIFLSREMTRSGFAHLCSGGKMNETVGKIDRSAVEPAIPLGRFP